MDHNRIPIPEIDGGQVAGENLLSLDVVSAATRGVRALGCIVEQGIEPRIRVAAAVSAFRREIRSREYITENVGLLSMRKTTVPGSLGAEWQPASEAARR
jgi:hypothetical protein